MAMSKRLYNLLHGFGSLLMVFPSVQSRPTVMRDYFSTRPTIEDTFRKDWETLSGDMNRAIEKVCRVQR
jgi:hypothetical protein